MNFYDMPTLINKIIHKKYKVASYLKENIGLILEEIAN